MSVNPIFTRLLCESGTPPSLTFTLPRTLDAIALRKRLSIGVLSAEAVRAMMSMPLEVYPSDIMVDRPLLTGW